MGVAASVSRMMELHILIGHKAQRASISYNGVTECVTDPVVSSAYLRVLHTYV